MISWSPPTTKIDGSPLNDLGGFIVYYGRSSGNYTNSVDVGYTASYVFVTSAPETHYYFAVASYDTYGNISGFSNEIYF